MQKWFAVTMLAFAMLGAFLVPFATITSTDSTSTIDKLLFFPAKYPTGNWSPTGIRYQDIYFKSEDGTRLHGWYFPAENGTAAILFAHGNAGNVATRLTEVTAIQSRCNVSMFVFDYRGFGRSEGVATVSGALMDTRRRYQRERR